MSQALYRKYRSRSLRELVGQSHVTDVLTRALEKGQIAHAYLLTGPRGVGKTSIARILAHEINGIEYVDDSLDLDIIEIDAASNRRIDDIRDLRERVHIAPSKSKYKVYIIDEVHMLTGESFNALLKTLEEPPAHVVFILATTEIDKLPATITSRTQTFHFRRIPNDVMVPHLRSIADSEQIAIDDDALDVIATLSDGSMRDAETALDQIRHSGANPITRDVAEQLLGGVSAAKVDRLLESVLRHDPKQVSNQLAAFTDEGISATIIARELSRKLLGPDADLQRLNLLDAILEVGKSYSPDMKLFSVLMRAATPQREAALITVTPSVSQPSPAPASTSKPKPSTSKAVSAEPPAQPAAEPEQKAESASQTPVALVDFDWDTLIAHVKQNFIALHSVLKPCQHTFDGETLTLYSKFKLHSTKLDDPKYRTMLGDAITSLTGSNPVVTVVFGSKPITDEGLASVAALMGGGEEVEANG